MPLFNPNRHTVSIVTQSSNYNITVLNEYIRADSLTPLTFTLPSAIGISGYQFEIKNINTGILTINTVLSQTIDNNLFLTLSQYEMLRVVSNGVSWDILDDIF